jgi:hypothetical protein
MRAYIWKRDEEGNILHRICENCGEDYCVRSEKQRFCSHKCRSRAHSKKALPVFENPTEASDYMVRLVHKMVGLGPADKDAN